MNTTIYTLVKKMAMKGLLVVALSLLANSAVAQAVTITYPVSAVNISRGIGSSKLTVKLAFNGACSGTTTVKVALPASVSYVASSVSKTGGTAALGVAESSITDLRNPVFAISGISAAGDEITFSLYREADCGSLTSAKDSIYVTTSGGCSSTSEIAGTVNTYNILSPSLSISTPASIVNTVIDTTLNRSSTITNGGNGVTDTVRYYIVYPSGGIVNTSGSNQISANSVNFTPYRTSGDTLFYKIYGATIFGGDSLFSNGETVNIVEPIKVKACDASTKYGVAWGRTEAKICSWFYASASVIMATGSPNLTSLVANTVGYTNKCTPYEYELTLTNGGTGIKKAASMYDIKVMQGQWSGSVTVLSNMDTNLFSITNVRIGTTVVSHSWVGRVLHIDLNNKLTSDPDGVGTGIEDLDGDGYYDDLPRGNAIKLIADIAWKCDLYCGYGKYNSSPTCMIQYRAMCGSSFENTDAKYAGGTVNYLYESNIIGKPYVPANVVGGVPFRINLKASVYANNSSFSSSATRYRWKLVLPSGMAVSGTGSPTYGTSSVSYSTSTSGDTIIYTSANNSLDSFSINLVYTCGSSGTKSFYYSLEKISNAAASCKCQGDLICAWVSTSAFCPSTCTNGPSTYVPKVRRTDSCLGWTSYTLATRVSASAISDYDLAKALYLDTINIIGSAVQNDSMNNLSVELTLPKTTIWPTGVNRLTPVQLTAYIYRAGSLKASATYTTYSSAASTTTVQSVIFNLTSAVTAAGGLIPDDSIYTISSYVVSTNDNLPANDEQTGLSWQFYNVGSGGSKVACNTTVPEMYLVGTDIVNGANAYITSGCNNTTLGGSTNYIARRFNTAGELYNNEYRPVMYVDSIVALMPSGYSWNYTHFQPTKGPTYTFLSPTISGNRYTFKNPGTWQALGLTVSNAYGAYIPFNVSPTCATDASESINFKFYIRDFYYAYAGKSTPSGLAYVLGSASGQTRNIAYTASQRPDLSLIDQSGVVQGVKGKLSWNLRMYNSGFNDAPYTWLAIPSKTGITVTKITEIATGDTMVPILYGSGNWYKLNDTGVAAGAYRDYKIDFAFSSCTLDSLKVLAGWNCGVYPTDPDAYPCSIDSVYLKVSSEPSQVQLNVLRQPGGGGTIDLCTTDSILLVVNSAQAANLLEPYVVMYPPAGFTISSPTKVEYPLGSGDYQNATVTAIGAGGYKIDLTPHSSIGVNGLLGTASSSTSYSPLGGDRQAKIKLDYTTDCDLTSGNSFVFYAYGKMPCGIAALGNGVTTSTTALRITGATSSGTAGAIIGISAGSMSCGTASTLSLSSVPTGLPTQAGDTMVYILPEGLGYAGSFVTGTNCDSCKVKVESGSAGSTVVKIRLQPGVAASSSLVYSFDVVPKGISCNSVVINGLYKRQISSLTCGSVLCTSSSIYLATFSSSAIPLKKPSIRLDSLSLVDTNAWLASPASNKLLIKYTNTGTLGYTANTDSLELFCGGSTTPFAVLPIAKSLAIGASDTSIQYITIPSSAACSAADLVTVSAKVRIFTNSGTEQCLCDSSTQIYNTKPTTTPSIIYCQYETASPLTASGASLKWYTVATGGLPSTTAPTPSTSTAGVKYFYVSQTSSTGVEGPRAEIKVTVNRAPDMLVVSSPNFYCHNSSAVSPLYAAKVVSTDTLLWYSVASGGTPSTIIPTPSTSTVGTTTYWVSAKSVNGCEGPRDSINVIIYAIPEKPGVSSPISYCQYETATALSATKDSASDVLVWYPSATGGGGSTSAPIPNTSVVGTTVYYVSAKSTHDCEGLRDSIVVVIKANAAVPVVSSPVVYCQNQTPVPLSATKPASDTLLWYSTATGGTPSYIAPTPSTSAVGTRTYWVSAKNTLNCEGNRDSINVVVNPIAGTPRVTSPKVYCQGDSAIALTAIPMASTDTLYWYTTASGGTGTPIAPIPSTATDGTTSYYVSAKNINGCEGRRAELAVLVNRSPDAPTVKSPVYYCEGETAKDLSASGIVGDTVLWYTSLYAATGSAISPVPNTSIIGTTKYFVGIKTIAGCQSLRDSITVTVSRMPSVPTVSSPVAYCQYATATSLSATKPLSTDSLLWYTSGSGGVGTSIAPTPSTATAGTTTYWVSAKTALNCEGQRDSINVVVNRTPSALSLSTPVVYCHYETPTLLSATAAIATDTLLWYTARSGGVGSKTAPTPSTSIVGTTTYWVSAKSSLNCEGERDSINVVVNRMPAVPTVSSPVVYCQGETALPLSASKSFAADTLIWYSVASGGLGTSIAPSPSTSAVGTTTYWVAAKSEQNCESARDSIKVVVNRTPSKATVVSPITYCQYATAIPLTATKPLSTDTLLWYTSASGGVGATVAPTPNTTTAGTTTYWVSAKTALNCEGDRDSINVVVNRTPSAITVSSPVVYCQYDASVALSASSASASDTLLWYTAASGGMGSKTIPIPSTTAVGLTTYWVSAKTGMNCESERDSIKVTVNRTPTKPLVESPVTYCQYATATPLTATKPLSTDTMLWYTSASGGVGATIAPTPSTATTGMTTYWVSAKSASDCEGQRDSINVIVNRTPATPTVVSPITYCQGETALSLTATKPLSTDTLIWYTSASGVVGTTIAPTPSTATVGTTIYWVSAKEGLYCEGQRDSIKVVVNRMPTKPIVVSPVVYCQYATAVSLDATKPLSTDTLLWYTTASGGVGTTIAPTPTTSTTGRTTYWVSAKTSLNCEGERDSIQVLINAEPVKPTVTSPINYCQGATVSALSAMKPTITDTLLWYNSASGGTPSKIAPTPSSASVGTTTYWVSSKSAPNCEGPRDSINVVVNRSPDKPIVASPISFCQNSTATALVATKAVSTDSLLWYTVPSGGVGTLIAPTPSTSTLGTTTYWVSSKTALNCEGQRDSINVVINRTPTKPTLVSSITYCQNASALPLSATKPLSTDTLIWYTSASGGVGSTIAPTPSTAVVGAITYWVSAKTALNCEGQRDSINVIVNRSPAKPTVVSPVNYCQGETALSLSATKSLGTDTLLWYTSASGGAGTTIAPIPSTASVGLTTFWVSAKTALNCEGQRDSINVVINRTPSKPIVVSPVVYCQYATAIPVTATKPLSTDTLLWYTSASGGVGAKTAPTPSAMATGIVTYWVSAKSNLNCEGQRDSIQVLINAEPVKPIVSTPVVYCQGATSVALAATKPSATDTLLWYTSASGGLESRIAPIPSTATAGSTTYWVSAKSAPNCEGPRDSINVIVNALPNKPSVISPVNLCHNYPSFALNATKPFPSDTLLWYTSASGGIGTTSAPIPSTATVGTTSYWVSAKSALNCEGQRDSITVVINRTPPKPLVASPITYCQNASALPLSATKPLSTDTLLWYTSAIGGVGTTTAPTPSTTTVGTTTYWVSAKTAMNCEGARDSINVIVLALPAAPIVSSPITYCQNDTAITLSATKALISDTLKWYTVPAAGTRSYTAPTPSTTSAGTVTYYVSATNMAGCEGPRASIAVIVNPTPTNPSVVSPITYCQNDTAIALTATGTLLKWYSSATTDTFSTTAPTPKTSIADTTIYFVSQTSTVTGCQSNRAPISVIVHPLPVAPTVITPINLCLGSPSVALTATGINLKWYNSSIGGAGSSIAPIPSTAIVGTTNYYVSQTSLLGCEGPRAKIEAIVNPLPVVTISSLSPSGFILCTGKTLTLKANAMNAKTHQWSYEATEILGATFDTLLVDTFGKYAVKVSDSFGCVGSAEITVYKDTTLLPTLSPVEIVICQESVTILTTNPGIVGHKFQMFQNGLPIYPGTIKENLKTIDDSGTYFVVVTNNYGCIDTTNNSFVSLYPKAVKPTISLVGTTLETTGSFMYYQWYKNDKKIIGAHAKKLITTGPGYYFLEITDNNGCLNQSDTILIENANSINQVTTHSIKIYPNPTNEKVYIDAPIKVNVKVYDAIGRLVLELKDARIVDLAPYADGNYLFRLFNQENELIATEKVQKTTN